MLKTSLFSLFLLPLAACGAAFPNAAPAEGDNMFVSGDMGPDVDGDGYGDLVDCDDGDVNVNPGEEEVLGNMVDDDCDGDVDCDDSQVELTDYGYDGDGDGWFWSADGVSVTVVRMCSDDDANAALISMLTDGTGDLTDFGEIGYVLVDASNPLLGYMLPDFDCDDADVNTYPAAAEVCDGMDNDCDASTIMDEAAMVMPWYADMDNDAFGDALDMVESCDMPMGYVADDTDCDDADANTYPGAPEFCDGLDNDCDASTMPDEAAMVTPWYADMDNDAFGDALDMVESCGMPMGYVADDTDCDDDNAAVNPDAAEVCDEMNVDEDCDVMPDDEDGSVDASGFMQWYSDEDGDSFAGTDAGMSCDGAPGLSLLNDDCNDAVEDINPDAIEVEDGVDNDCDDEIDGADPSVTCFDSIYLTIDLTTAVDTITLTVSDNMALNGEVYVGSVPGVTLTEETLSYGSLIIVEFEHCFDATTVVSYDVAYDDGTNGCELTGSALGAIDAYQETTSLNVNDGADDGTGNCVIEITE